MQKTFCSISIAAPLEHYIENENLLIDYAQQPVLFVTNGDHDIINMTFVPSLAAESFTNVLSKSIDGEMLCLVRNDNPALYQLISDHTQAERKSKLELHTTWAIAVFGNQCR